MHPVLIQIPLPAWQIPWLPLLLTGAGLGLVLAAFGRKQRARDLMIVGVAVAVACLALAIEARGSFFRLSPVPVYSYGALLSLSFVIGWFLTLRLARGQGVPLGIAKTSYFVAALSALVGARVVYVLTNLDEFSAIGSVFDVRGGGLVAYGGFVGGLLGSVAYLSIRRVSWLGWGDAAAPSLAAGLLVTRIGCYLYGCDFGKPLGLGAPAWLQRVGTFPRWEGLASIAGSGSPAWLQHVAERGLGPDASSSLPVHPTQLYEATAGGLLLVALLVMYKRRQFTGQILLTFALAYAAVRFGLEVLRDDAGRGSFGPRWALSSAVPTALLVLALGFGFGPARSVRSIRWRWVARCAALVPAVAAFVLLRPADFQLPETTQLSTSQWFALLTGLVACAAWSPLGRRPKAEGSSRGPSPSAADDQG
jgi:phosphatidylglycerol:prolipoprotein diacylglycerol transferase